MADPYWIQAGDHTWALVIEGSIAGLVYWTGAGLGELDGPGGDPVVTDPGWFWLSVDDPDNHVAVTEGVEISREMSHDELVGAMDDARALAARGILGSREAN